MQKNVSLAVTLLKEETFLCQSFSMTLLHDRSTPLNIADSHLYISLCVICLELKLTFLEIYFDLKVIVAFLSFLSLLHSIQNHMQGNER